MDCIIRFGAERKYSYLADGSKASALKGNGEGLVYRGSLIYRRASDAPQKLIKPIIYGILRCITVITKRSLHNA